MSISFSVPVVVHTVTRLFETSVSGGFWRVPLRRSPPLRLFPLAVPVKGGRVSVRGAGPGRRPTLGPEVDDVPSVRPPLAPPPSTHPPLTPGTPQSLPTEDP